jgi:membrane protease YdiL (CAAX protease family)
MLWVLWIGARRAYPIANLNSLFVSFALLLAPLWFFGFGAGNWLRNIFRSKMALILGSTPLAVPWIVFMLWTGRGRWEPGIWILLLHPLLSALLVIWKPLSRMGWQDWLALAAIAAIYLLRVLDAAWPFPGSTLLPKLFVADLVLYLYCVVRKLDGMGYSFVPIADAFKIGLREFAYFLPLGIGLGMLLNFIHFHPRVPSPLAVVSGILITLLLIAVPEEMFFRGVLQNLLETRFSKTTALLLASLLFGLSHFHKGAPFGWKYILIATMAGVFYGRAWRAQRQLLASIITHTAVDTVWSLWFR